MDRLPASILRSPIGIPQLSTRERDGKIFLTGSPSTTIVGIEDVAVCDFGELGECESVSELSGTVTAVQTICERCCPKRKTQQEWHGKAAVRRCAGYKFMQKPSSFLPIYSGILCLSCHGKDHTLSMSNSAICVYFTEYDLCGLTNDVKDMEGHFITVGEFCHF